MTAKNAAEIFDKCGEMLKSDSLRPVSILQRSGIKQFCTTDEPFDDLQWHRMIEERDYRFGSFRPSGLTSF